MSLFLKALAGEPLERFPVWLMRQAGRYMSSYQAYRNSHTLFDLFHNPKVAAEITLLPIKELDVDAAIIFSDILVILKSIGLEVHYPDQGGPFASPKLQSAEDVAKLPKLNVESVLDFLPESIERCKEKLNVPLIGFAGGPFTVASYAIEERGKRAELTKTKAWMMRDPQSFSQLLDLLCDQTIDSLKMQVKAGAQAVQVFDSWAGCLDSERFKLFSVKYLEKIVAALEVPVLYFSRGSCALAHEIIKAHPAGISLDWQWPMEKVRQEIGDSVCLQGNFDPALLLAQEDVILEEVTKSLDRQPMRHTIINLGHGVMPHLPYNHVQAFVNAVKGYRRKGSHCVTTLQEEALKREWPLDSPLS